MLELPIDLLRVRSIGIDLLNGFLVILKVSRQRLLESTHRLVALCDIRLSHSLLLCPLMLHALCHSAQLSLMLQTPCVKALLIEPLSVLEIKHRGLDCVLRCVRDLVKAYRKRTLCFELFVTMLLGERHQLQLRCVAHAFSRARVVAVRSKLDVRLHQIRNLLCTSNPILIVCMGCFLQSLAHGAGGELSVTAHAHERMTLRALLDHLVVAVRPGF